MMIKMLKGVLSFALMASMLMEMAMAANYTVGAPNGGWDQSTNLQAWANSISFFQGDFLIFRFAGNHDVTEVSEPNFSSCTSRNPVQPPFTAGTAVVPLTSSGSRFFICGRHCSTGMRVRITIAAAPASPSPSPAPT